MASREFLFDLPGDNNEGIEHLKERLINEVTGIVFQFVVIALTDPERADRILKAWGNDKMSQRYEAGSYSDGPSLEDKCAAIENGFKLLGRQRLLLEAKDPEGLVEKISNPVFGNSDP